MYSGNVRKVSRKDIKVVKVSCGMESTNQKNELFGEYQSGLDEYISVLNSDKKPLHDVMLFRKESNGIILDVALQWCLDGYSEKMLGYANSIRTVDGGTHIDGVKAAITRTLNSLMEKFKVIKEKDVTLSGEHFREGLTCIVSVIVPNPEFEGQTQTRLGNPYVREFVEQSVQEYLTEYFELHPDLLERIIIKSFNAYKTALAVKKVNELFRSKSVLTPRTGLVKLSKSSSEKSEILIGSGDSSRGGAALHNPNRRFQSKRTQEQLWKNNDDAVSRASLENVAKRQKLTRSCVLSSKTCYAPIPQYHRDVARGSNPQYHKDVTATKTLKDVHGSNPQQHNKDVPTTKTLKDVARGSSKAKRPFIPIGPGFQAEIPVWVAPTKKGKFYGSPGDSNTLRWLGTGVWPTYSLKKKVNHKKVGEGRSDSCSCALPGSSICVKKHVKEARELLEKDIGRAFFTWEFDKIGEEIVSKSWTAKEEQRFEALVKKEPLSTSEGFWEFASEAFPRKSKKDLLSYYYNVYLIKRMRSPLVNSSSAAHSDSDDDHYDDFLAG